MNVRTARQISWSFVGLYFLLLGTGFTFQVRNGVTFEAGKFSFPVLVTLMVMVGVWAVIGALIVSHHPGHPIGWLLCIGMNIAALDQFAFGYAYQGLIHAPGSLPGADLMLIWLSWSGQIPSMYLFILIFLLFPTGRPLSSRWRPVIWLGAAAVTAVLVLDALQPGPVTTFPFLENPFALAAGTWKVIKPFYWAAFILLAGCVLSAVLSLLVRLRIARGDERQQVKWFLFAAAILPLSIPVQELGRFDSTGILLGIAYFMISLAVVGMAIATAFAIFKYRLYDIDIIIRRTLSYAILTAILAGLYFGGVVLLQNLFEILIGRSDSPLITVLSTLAIAALFNPLRLRVQDFIDRRFYRDHYDAEQTLETFAAAARDEVEMERLANTLLEVVDETVHPEQTSLWLMQATGSEWTESKIHEPRSANP